MGKSKDGETQKVLNQLCADKKCYHCGKWFSISHGWVEQYAYKQKVNKNMRYFCSWTCLCAGRVEKQQVLEYE